jgi:catechol-2,3-dioxygenase
MNSKAPEAKLVNAISSEIVEIDHLAIAVQDLENAIRWYSEALGFSVVEQRTTKGERTSIGCS